MPEIPETIKEEIIHNQFFKLKKDRLKTNNQEMDYFYTQPRDVVSLIAITEKNEIILCKQYRHPLRKVIYDAPAGIMEKGEIPKEAALRELEEETGYKANSIKSLGSYFAVPGHSSMKIHFFLATELQKTQQKLDPTESIDIELIPIKELKNKILNNQHEDMPSATSFLLYLLTTGHI